MPVISDLIGAVSGGMRFLLVKFFETTGSYGVAIILLTFIVRLALYPLTLGQTKSMQAMKLLQPKLKELQQKYKDKPQEYQKKTLELYRQHKVNPVGGCLPMLVQLPFLWALYNVLRDFEFTTKFLLWDLGSSDKWLVLPVLAGITTYLQTALTVTDPSQKSIAVIMPVFIVFLSLKLPAGLVLYWVASNAFSLVQQYVITRQTGSAPGRDAGTAQGVTKPDVIRPKNRKNR
ncbi:MAG: membrane protein insertase YidC [Firmicutes bacterium]|nr:membrane protein insertase YidC [Bacillota bacterium]